MDILPSKFKIKSREELFDDCLDEVKRMVGALKEGQAIAVKREANDGDNWKPIFTIYTQGVVDLSVGSPKCKCQPVGSKTNPECPFLLGIIQKRTSS